MRNLEEMMKDFFKFSENRLEPCLPKEPLTKLDGNGRAAVLNYNLPQSTCFTAAGFNILDLNADVFKDDYRNEPEVHFWSQVDGISTDHLVEMLQTSTEAAAQGAGNELLEFEDLANKQKSRSAEPVDIPAETDDDAIINDVTVDSIAAQVAKGFRPYFKRNLYGKRVLRYSKKPTTAIPTITIVEHYRVCSYLGDYGAGKTVKTFSLLPGEKTEITLKTYKNSTEVKSKAENILDSFTEDSAKELESLIEGSVDTTNSSSRTVSNDFDVRFTSKIEADVAIKIVDANVSYGIDTGYKRSATKNSSRDENVKSLNRAMDKHVSKSSAVREIEVNTETTTTVETGEETTITRTIENINKSRVLNFVFRQLIQEYFTITYLEDITLIFSNGYPEATFSSKLDNIEGFLAAFLKTEEQKDKVRDEILNELSSIYDFQGNRVRFVEKVEHGIFDINDQKVEDQSYYRKQKDLQQTYRGKTVPGIILNVESRMLRTDSVIIDALLGQGEALDCFNLKLQEAANMKAYMENFTMYLQQLEKQQAMEIIDKLEDPKVQAELYKRIYGDCCNEPQTIIHK